MPRAMKAAVFVEPGPDRVAREAGPRGRAAATRWCASPPRPSAAPTSTSSRASTRSREGLTVGHEPVGVIEKLGSAVHGYGEGQRVIAGAITPCGHSNACLCGCCSQDGAGTAHGWKPIGGWKFGNTIDGCQAEYVLVPDAMANLAPVPDGLTRRAGADVPGHHVHRLRRRRERGDPHRRHGGGVRAGADRPLRHRRREADGRDHASSPWTGVPERLEMARRLGADHVVDFRRSTRSRRSCG